MRRIFDGPGLQLDKLDQGGVTVLALTQGGTVTHMEGAHLESFLRSLRKNFVQPAEEDLGFDQTGRRRREKGDSLVADLLKAVGAARTFAIQTFSYPLTEPVTLDPREIAAVLWRYEGQGAVVWARVVLRSGYYLDVVPPCKGDGSLGPFKKPAKK